MCVCVCVRVRASVCAVQLTMDLFEKAKVYICVYIICGALSTQIRLSVRVAIYAKRLKKCDTQEQCKCPVSKNAEINTTNKRDHFLGTFFLSLIIRDEESLVIFCFSIYTRRKWPPAGLSLCITELMHWI